MSKFKSFIITIMANLPTKTELAAFLAVSVVLAVAFHAFTATTNSPTSASVMIVNRAMNSGGTGIILNSTESSSWILTNDHVCGVVKDNGGVVRAATGDFQVNSIVESQVSDLCLVNVLDNLGVNTTVSPTAPNEYDTATVSGHPALMPNVLSKGHFSGRNIIQVVTGFRDCTDADLADPNLGVLCAFLGGIPILKSYESVLVTALIQPGSSGSGVYNSKNELTNVVFAGSGPINYAWTVPYEQVTEFLSKETAHLKVQHINNEINFLQQQTSSKRMFEAMKKCDDLTTIDTPEKRAYVKQYCNIIKHDVIWVK